MHLAKSPWGGMGKKGAVAVSSEGMVLEGHEPMSQFNK